MYKANDARYEKMEYNRCGKSGLKLPKVSLGLWHNFGEQDSYDNMKIMCRTAFDNGITHFDLANNYGPGPGTAEMNFGKILKEELYAYRDELLISTKAGYHMWDGPYGDNGSRKYLLASLDASLKRLGVDYVDIFYHHRPDPDTPLEETMDALAQSVRSGKALYIGLSNYDGDTMAQAADILKSKGCPFIINQNKYNIFDRTIETNGLKKRSAELGKGVICFSPLAQGLLTDRYIDSLPSDSRVVKDGRFLNKDDVEAAHVKVLKLNEIAQERGETLSQMALKWIFKDEDITSVIVGASKASQIMTNLGVLNSPDFSEEELRLIDDAIA